MTIRVDYCKKSYIRRHKEKTGPGELRPRPPQRLFDPIGNAEWSCLASCRLGQRNEQPPSAAWSKHVCKPWETRQTRRGYTSRPDLALCVR